MNTQVTRTIFAYNRWANRRLLAAASLLPPEEFNRDLHASFGSVRGTLLHILWGERRWLRFWQDGSFMPDAVPEDFPDPAALEAGWASLEQDQQLFEAGLTDELLAAPRRVWDNEYTLGELVQHLLNHSTYHRGQVALLLRQLGQSPPASDYRLFLTEAR